MTFLFFKKSKYIKSMFINGKENMKYNEYKVTLDEVIISLVLCLYVQVIL
jgi:hypothetical protein